MTLINRFSRLLSADVHAVLDRLEDPATLTQHALREMELAVLAGQQILDQQNRRLNQLQRHHEERQRADVAIDDELDLVFAPGPEDALDRSTSQRLARPLVRRRLQLRRDLETLAERMEQTRIRKEESEVRLTRQRETLEQLRQKAALFVGPDTDNSAIDSGLAKGSQDDFAFSDAELEVALLREQRRRNHHE